MKAMTSYHNKIYRYLSLVFSAGFLFFALSYLPVTVGTAAEADFSICLYNPSSRKRKDYLQKACDLMMRSKDPDTVCGTVSNIGREGETFRVMTLKELRDTRVDMFTTVYIGNSQTKMLNGKMVTPRGYIHG